MKVVKTELLINVTPQETRVALLENGVLQEIHLERPDTKGIVGNIYMGKVVRILPGMQAAFIDIGMERTGFLHVSDILPTPDSGEMIDLNAPEADIRQWLHDGQMVMVQAIKDPLGSKGARLTGHLSIASRYLVHMPDLDHIAVSLRLEDEQERQRLHTLVTDELSQNAQYIIRTVAHGAHKQALQQDLGFLQKLWDKVQERSKGVKQPTCIYQDLALVERAFRDMVNVDIEAVHIDCEHTYQNLQQFVHDFLSGYEHKVKHYQADQPLFELYGVEEALAQAIERRVPLKSGGYLVIDQTEAMTTIDVNSGSFVSGSNLAETVLKTNLEAAQAIARQLRLRHLGGIIILDFIDMVSEEHRRLVMSELDNHLASDHAFTNVLPMSALGLVEMTRKRTHDSLLKQLCEPCVHCDGKGYIKTKMTIAYEILRDLQREANTYPQAQGFVMLMNPDLVTWLIEEASAALSELEEQIKRPIQLKATVGYEREQYDIMLL